MPRKDFHSRGDPVTEHLSLERQAQLRTMFEEAPLGIALIDSLSGHIYEVNPRFAEICGRTRDEMATIDWMSITHPDDVQEDLDNMGLLNAGKIDGFKMNKRYIRPDGSIVWIEMTIAPVAVADESRPRHLCMIDDITARLQLEAQSRQAQKLESLGLLAGGIAHDFNNLLVGIMGNAEVALSDTPPDAAASRPIRKILDASLQASDLTNQMLAYSGKGHFVVEEIDIDILVSEMESLLRSSIPKKVELRHEPSGTLPAVMADTSQLRQIVMNLITNAADSIGEEIGQVTVKTGTMECDRAFFDDAQLDTELPSGRYVQIQVADTGRGMSEETISSIFDPFFTTKSLGRGLGLAAVQGIVRGHKGALRVESEPGRGTTFKVYLPALDHPAEPIENRIRQDSASHERGTILVVDDVEMVRDLGRNMLESAGFTVVTAVDGSEAVELFRERHAEIDCVVLDLNMPGMNGEETFEELRKIQSEVRVILSSGYPEKESLEHFGGKGLAGFIHKPYSMKTLTAKVREALTC